jgi:hypothetical protein
LPRQRIHKSPLPLFSKEGLNFDENSPWKEDQGDRRRTFKGV